MSLERHTSLSVYSLTQSVEHFWADESFQWGLKYHSVFVIEWKKKKEATNGIKKYQISNQRSFFP